MLAGQRSDVEWCNLPEQFRDDNCRAAAEHFNKHLPALGLEAHRVKAGDIKLWVIREDEIEKLSRTEHDSWMAKKVEQGWKYGEKRNDEKKIHPLLKPWDELPGKDREKTREMIRQIPRLLKDIGLEVRPIESKPAE